MTIIQLVKNANLKRFLKRINALAKEIKKPTLVLLFKYAICFIIRGFGFSDYFEYGLYKKSFKEIKEYISTKEENDFYAKYSPYSKNKVLEVKTQFMEAYKEYTKRDFVLVRDNNYDEFLAFFNKHEQLMVKPREDSGGNGVKKINTKDIDAKELYESLLANNSFVEEVIAQDESMSVLASNSINTIRVMTSNFNGNTKVFFACMRCGRGACVDNFHSGGMGANVDVNSGTVYTNAVDKDCISYEYHPVSNIKFIGFKVPMWDDVKKLCIAAHKKTPNCMVVGWDVAISDKGPCLVEGNNSPGWDLPQTAEGKGLRKLFISLNEEAMLK